MFLSFFIFFLLFFLIENVSGEKFLDTISRALIGKPILFQTQHMKLSNINPHILRTLNIFSLNIFDNTHTCVFDNRSNNIMLNVDSIKIANEAMRGCKLDKEEEKKGRSEYVCITGTNTNKVITNMFALQVQYQHIRR
eukprot:GHVR01029450.1.p2 GENE.GHVR01029450.1~~GHVR01029450.1.p2  ORF type:complete len:138 (+),score=25.15 GHVR01029450.1:117-530(+)